MSKTLVPKKLREQIVSRAGNRCEYCKLPAPFALYTLEVDHIIPEKQGGPTTIDNLALACRYCNAYKGVSVVHYDFVTKEVTLLFHPREQEWHHHFKLLSSGVIEGKSSIGKATIRVLRLNDRTRIEARERLIANGVLIADK